jgi:hypothetical protein
MMMLLGAWSWSERVRWLLNRSGRRFTVAASVVGWRWLGLADAIIVVAST